MQRVAQGSVKPRLPGGTANTDEKTPSPPYNVPHPFGHPQGGLLCITLYFSNAGNASAAFFPGFLASAVVLRRGRSASAGASAGIRALVLHLTRDLARPLFPLLDGAAVDQQTFCSSGKVPLFVPYSVPYPIHTRSIPQICVCHVCHKAMVKPSCGKIQPSCVVCVCVYMFVRVLGLAAAEFPANKINHIDTTQQYIVSGLLS